jgi:hypothetical protein
MTDWIQSWSGKCVEPDQVGGIEEIAHVLAAKVRFQGHTRVPYSVAEHCVRGARSLPPAFALAFLLHEVSEVYLPDAPTPIKRRLVVSTPGGSLSWELLEQRHAKAVLAALGRHDASVRFLDAFHMLARFA